MNGPAIVTECVGEMLSLFPQRAIYWPRTATLFITDPHFGKAATFRSAGIAIPPGDTGRDLARLDGVLDETGAERLVVLGDFFHARPGRSTPVLAALADWRARHTALAIVIVQGNHDRHAGEPPADWRIRTVTEPFDLPPFVCRHQPLDAETLAAGEGYVLAGHVHPVVVLRERSGSQLRLPCFWFGAQQALLPAFGSFTGGYTVSPRRGDRVFAVGPERVVAVRG